MAFRSVKPGVQRLWEQLEDEEHAIVMERQRLQDIWKQISAMHKANAEAREAFENEASFDFIDGNERVLLNVGGHVFQTTAEVLCRDRYSLLACVCKTDSPISKDEEGTFFFERDWWIFRYILQFLRSGDLPQEQALLREMYDEAAFYRLNSLRRAIQRSRRAAKAATGGSASPGQGTTAELSRRLGPTAAARTSAAGHRASPGHSMRNRNPLREALPDPFGFSCRNNR